MKALSIAAGVGLILFSMMACVVSVIAILDPVGTKMADDSDPFGTPPSRVSSIVWLAGFASVGIVGVYVVYRCLCKSVDIIASRPQSNS